MLNLPQGPARGSQDPATDRLAPLRGVLNQLHGLIDQLDAARYCAQPVATYGGSVGGHVRHCLDHVVALLAGVEGGVIDYENRQRGTDVETNPDTARAELVCLEARLAELPDAVVDRPVTIAVLLAPDAPALRAPSSLAREIAFVVSHTVHHNAMIGGMVKVLGGSVPADFGVAAGTLRHRQNG